jgi:hypothetical protein
MTSLTSFWALWRLVSKTATLCTTAHSCLLALAGVILRVAVRGLSLMCRMLMIARLEVLELRYAFAPCCHELSSWFHGRGHE